MKSLIKGSNRNFVQVSGEFEFSEIELLRFYCTVYLNTNIIVNEKAYIFFNTNSHYPLKFNINVHI